MTLGLSLLNPSEGSGEAARKALPQVYKCANAHEPSETHASN